VAQLENETCVPAELQQKLPRRIRLAAAGILYLVTNVLVSTAIVTFIILAGSLTPKDIKDRNDLQREGSVTFTNDVRIGGKGSATVFYTFTYNGKSYSGKAYLPREYSKKVLSYSKAGNFPVTFLPGDPTINHPYDWRGVGSFPSFLYLLILLIIVQWSALIRFLLPDLRLARNGLVAVGRVTNSSDGGIGGIYLKYEFRDADGLPMNGRGEHPVRQETGAQICVLYLPEDSGHSRPYPLSFFRAAK
jgi:hypothetical protein